MILATWNQDLVKYRLEAEIAANAIAGK